MTRRGHTLRLFVAAKPPQSAAADMLDALRTLDLPPHRTTPPQQVHLTLLFLGPVEPGKIDDLIESMRRAAAGLTVAHTRARRLITLPRSRAPRLVAAEVEPHPTLIELRRRLATRLAHHPRPDPADRFLPHMTLCRFHTGARARLDIEIDAAPFDIDRVELLRSKLTPAGAEYTLVDFAPLDARQ